jgi:sec-independent protein translocase protein TatC
MGMTLEPNSQLQTAAAPVAVRRGRRLRLPFRRRNDAPKPVAGDMSIIAHLVELRNRLFISVFSLIPGVILGFVFSGDIIHVLRSPLPTKDPLTALGLTDALMIQVEISLVAGCIIAMPVILYEFWAYISPGLTPSERKTARPWVPLAMGFFAIGVGVAYFILPYATGFLYNFQSSDIHIMLTADAYFGFVSMLFLAFGLVMEFPIVLVLLSKVGMLSSMRLRKSRKMALLGIVAFSAMITPGADLVSPTVMAVTMYGLYEASIVMIRMDGK